MKFQKDDYAEFQAYDRPKSFLEKYRDGSGKIPNPSTIQKELDQLQAERDSPYTEYQIAKQLLASQSPKKIPIVEL